LRALSWSVKIGLWRRGTVVGSVLVTGGTGTLGRAVVAELRTREQAVRVLSRRPPGSAPAGLEDVDWVTGDLRSGAGLDRAVSDAGVVVHCATDVRRPRRDVEGTRNLLSAARAAGAWHLVYISIVGVDRVPLPYYGIKLEVEQLIEASNLPWTVLRATQFHDLVASALRVLTRPPAVLLPAGTSFQPVDVRDVAARLVELALSPATGRAADLGGPQVWPVTDLARAYLHTVRRRRPVWPVPLPGAIARGYRQGGHLAPESAVVGRPFEDYLAERAFKT